MLLNINLFDWNGVLTGTICPHYKYIIMYQEILLLNTKLLRLTNTKQPFKLYNHCIKRFCTATIVIIIIFLLLYCNSYSLRTWEGQGIFLNKVCPLLKGCTTKM